ncbi:ImmA/IrrE family metallo-endopeptidase [Streptococcus pluranimalium]
MDLATIIKETEKLGVTILFTIIPILKGRYDNTLGYPCIYIDKDLTDTEKINVILHERVHFLKEDQNNILTYTSSYAHRIENEAEKDRILDFMSLVNQEYPIDQSFNYIEYMKNAFIPNKYENYVKQIAKEIYLKNQRKIDY